MSARPVVKTSFMSAPMQEAAIIAAQVSAGRSSMAVGGGVGIQQRAFCAMPTAFGDGGAI